MGHLYACQPTFVTFHGDEIPDTARQELVDYHEADLEAWRTNKHELATFDSPEAMRNWSKNVDEERADKLAVKREETKKQIVEWMEERKQAYAKVGVDEGEDDQRLAEGFALSLRLTTFSVAPPN
ncbi:hypothetical protein EJ08DRAFT_661651 [Tothia fuscella]|uniref:Uncharacterized protein n=1 Tax=Tothia fuscella TaxID=1048955 RepID=A0A9P4TY51_9PEZI|nr:hypothetical protein EJ08DRAFT_661651 [Tothia fuscella]